MIRARTGHLKEDLFGSQFGVQPTVAGSLHGRGLSSWSHGIHLISVRKLRGTILTSDFVILTPKYNALEPYPSFHPLSSLAHSYPIIQNVFSTPPEVPIVFSSAGLLTLI